MTISDIVNRYRRHVADERMIGPDEDQPATYIDTVARLNDILRDAQSALDAVEEIKAHGCSFDSEDYCTVCGADGRG